MRRAGVAALAGGEQLAAARTLGHDPGGTAEGFAHGVERRAGTLPARFCRL